LPSAQKNGLALLIDKLISQTGDEDSPVAQNRWHRRLAQWRNQPVTDSPRLLMVIDGLNQKPDVDWARIVEYFNHELGAIGGRVIVTARAPFFNDNVKPRIDCPLKEVNIPEWSNKERDDILQTYGINSFDLQPKVTNSLCNPRLLGIALELFGKRSIVYFEELSVSRLLFEHIRTSEKNATLPRSATAFKNKLQKDAQEILSRVKNHQTDDLHIFESEVVAVADGRFYQTVEDEPNAYALQEDGLTLALGFAIVDILKKAKRNQRDLDNELATILEPIGALDDTAGVVVAAMTIAALSDWDTCSILASLIKGYLPLQNPMNSQLAVFASLAKNKPEGFLKVAHDFCFEDLHLHHHNYDWIEKALIFAGHDERVWQIMEAEVLAWMCQHTLSPDVQMYNNEKRGDKGKIETERTKILAKISESLQSLSVAERNILAKSREVDGAHLDRLLEQALTLLAGKPLAQYATQLVTMRFTQMLNSSFRSPRKDFIDLIRMNNVDWQQTRAALLKMVECLRGSAISSTGQWTLHSILEATGHVQDGRESDVLYESLTNDSSYPRKWRLVENYCATDPCDPNAKSPQNILETAEDYVNLEFLDAASRGGLSKDDFFLRRALPSLVRFAPAIASEKYRSLMATVSEKSGESLRTVLSELRKHASLLVKNDANKLVEKWISAKCSDDETSTSKNEQAWITNEDLLILAFPLLDEIAQADLYLSIKNVDHVSLTLMDLSKPMKTATLIEKMLLAVFEGIEEQQYLLLVHSTYTLEKIPIEIQPCIIDLAFTGSVRVRTNALGLIKHVGE
jgi:hypothetical protein